MFSPESSDLPRKEGVVFFDFDNTLTPLDVLDSIIERFSINQDWMEFEKDWKAGKIGSKECLEGQLRSVRVTQETLSGYLATIEIDPFFKKLLRLLKARGLQAFIVSDSFTFIIRKILHNQGIGPIKIFANEIHFQKDRVIPSFPFLSPDCSRCAHCKKRHVLEHQDKFTLYVGDGLSDVCPCLVADIVFAKGSLLDYLKRNGKACFEFSDLSNLCSFFEGFTRPARKPKKVLAVA